MGQILAWTGRQVLNNHSMFPLHTHRPGVEDMHTTKHIHGKHRGLREQEDRQVAGQAGSIRDNFLEEVMADLCLKI